MNGPSQVKSDLEMAAALENIRDAMTFLANGTEGESDFWEFSKGERRGLAAIFEILRCYAETALKTVE
ncbi:hypothetical protein [Desulfatirhabdium butyrativorans]|uniref:hypothetical protein n=1 Tax=Desulfatirhabdium butyrativorans TaxID=340467 RepID=UPI0004882B2C|nr:hypothetical protein [Desulfatirhabdium butyrativorans]